MGKIKINKDIASTICNMYINGEAVKSITDKMDICTFTLYDILKKYNILKRGKLITENFITKATKIHNNKYNYSLSSCNKNIDQVIIICPIHGEFTQRAADHLAGKGCQACGKNKRLTLQDAKNIAIQYGGQLLSNEIKNGHTDLLWQCKNGHIFTKKLHDIRNRNYWCNQCNISHISEEICRVYFETIFNKKFIKIRPKWLINSNGNKLELDGYCEELKIAFEHNGDQHYNEIPVFGQNRLKQTQENDQVKIDLCKKYGITLVIIQSLHTKTKLYQLEEIVKNLAKDFNIPIKEKYFYDFSHLNNLDVNINKLKSLQILASHNGGECLSSTYFRAASNYEFKCVREHLFKLTGDGLAAGKWCRKCKFYDSLLNKIGMSETDLRNKYIESDCYLFAFSKKINISYSTICKLFKGLNIPRKIYCPPNIDKNDVYKMYVDNKISSIKIAKKYNTHCRIIINILKEMKVKIRTKKKYKSIIND